MAALESASSPRKRLKMEDGGGLRQGDTLDRHTGPVNSSTDPVQAQAQREAALGILDFTAPAEFAGFGGILKKRYTDFLVNEISPDGTVVHLTSYEVPRLASKSGPPDGTKGAQSTKGTDPGVENQLTDTPAQTDPAPPQPSEASALAPAAGDQSRSIPAQETVQDTAENPAAASEGISTSAKVTAPSKPEQSDATSNWRQYAETHTAFSLSSEDRAALEKHLGPTVTDLALQLFNRIVASPHRSVSQYGKVKSDEKIDRASRTELHQTVRRVFNSRIESSTDSDGIFEMFAAAARAGEGRGSKKSTHRGAKGHSRAKPISDGPILSKKEQYHLLGGEFLHFSIYKENKDTLEVISFLARSLHLPAKELQFAGMKDRRGATVQRASVRRVMAERLSQLNATLRAGTSIGNFKYEQGGIELGELSGNEFVITLRDCTFSNTTSLSTEERLNLANGIIQTATENLTTTGFLNYYGLQRFGSFETRTDQIGLKLLQGDYEGAVNAILSFNPAMLPDGKGHDGTEPKFTYDDQARAVAIALFRKTGRSHEALEKLPRKFSAEANIIRFLGGRKSNDYLTAISTMHRNLRSIYVHAYQSRIWNYAATERWRIGGVTVLEGDLVLVNEHKDKELNKQVQAEGEPHIDEDGELIVAPAEHDRAITEEERFERARPLSKEEASSGQYDIHDIVLPTPGYDILYPAGMVAFYENLMAKEEFGGLDPHDMRRKYQDFSLSGHYRKLLAKPLRPCSFQVIPYVEENQQFVKTDLQCLEEGQKKGASNSKGQPSRFAGHHQVPELEMALDGAVESKIKAFKETLLDSTGTEQKKNGADDKMAIETEDGAQRSQENLTQKRSEHVLESSPEKIAVVLTLQLGSSTYATMALRELSRGKVTQYKTDYGGTR